MMIGVQRRLTELGRIRLGDKGTKGQPQKLTHFRLTSASKVLLEAAAGLYGGQVKPWPDAPDQGYWQLYTTSDTLDILIPPTLMAYSQKYELWSGGGAQRRCDGDFEEIGARPCVCDPDDRECDITTRVSVMLPRVPGLGVWRLETKGWNAAASLPSTLDLLSVGGRGTFVPASLRLEQRSSKKAGQTRRYVVPVIDLTGVTIQDLLAAGAAEARQIGPGDDGANPLAIQSGAIVRQETDPGPSRPPRGTKVQRPELGPSPDLPATSDFRKPEPPPAPAAAPPPPPPPAPPPDEPDEEPAAADAPALGGWAVEEPPAEQPADPPAAGLVEAIRAAAEASNARGQMRDPARKAVFERLVKPIGAPTFRTVVTAAYGDSGFTSPSAAQAAGLITVADSFADEASLTEAWTAAADAINASE